MLTAMVKGSVDVNCKFQAQLAASFLQNPTPYPKNQPSIFSGRDERAGHHQSKLRALPAHQGFKASDVKIEQGNDRLVVDAKFLAFGSMLSVIHPPSGCPITGAVTIAMLYKTNAAGRFLAGNVSTRTACSTGASPPPPIPCSTRKKMSRPCENANPQSSELAVKSTTQIM
jgi:hypothetical protein